ncbi:MAG: EAL domain-containing protein, partial [Lachnospiraceae bacterium]|nr:EAL domain-containing protein [Lachnospiraceae bacterium]
YIEIELTESSGYDDFTSLFDFVKRIKSYGIHTSIDNFGTGYASVKLISDLDINVIKLDRSFVTGITDAVLEDIDASFSDGRTALKRAKNNEVIMKSIIETAHALGIKVICSGIENEQQEKLLKRHGCDMGQGFLYDKALPHDIFAKKLQGIS